MVEVFAGQRLIEIVPVKSDIWKDDCVNSSSKINVTLQKSLPLRLSLSGLFRSWTNSRLVVSTQPRTPCLELHPSLPSRKSRPSHQRIESRSYYYLPLEQQRSNPAASSHLATLQKQLFRNFKRTRTPFQHSLSSVLSHIAALLAPTVAPPLAVPALQHRSLIHRALARLRILSKCHYSEQADIVIVPSRHCTRRPCRGRALLPADLLLSCLQPPQFSQTRREQHNPKPSTNNVLRANPSPPRLYQIPRINRNLGICRHDRSPRDTPINNPKGTSPAAPLMT